MLGALTFLMLGCAPPDAPVGSLPEIRLIYPSDSATLDAVPTGDGATCTVTTFIAVDILNFDFVPPAAGQEVVEGQGHYHVDGGLNSTNRPSELYTEDGEFLVSCPNDKDGESHTLQIRAYLVTANHEDINDTPEHEDFAEPALQLVDAPKGKD
jgi:hypothetical protein